jgi:integrase
MTACDTTNIPAAQVLLAGPDTIHLSLDLEISEELLGHSDIAITLGLYGHVTPPMQQEAANAMGALFHTMQESD